VKTIYQGDFIGFGGFCEYTPNTITYIFREVIYQNIIIAPHTCYYAENDLRDAVAMPDRSIWNDTPHIKFVQPTASIFAGAEYFADLKDVCKFARVMALGVEFVTPKVAAQITQQINACIREGKEVNADDFENPNLISFWKLVKSIKEDAVFLCRNDGPAAYINGNRIDAEGYVMTNDFGMFKLVNREVFSYANFNHGRFQCAS
jgi:exopolysaccharide biosynthesis predicted pyruvyltransferase EpsI